MSQVPPILSVTENDIKKLLACRVHIGSENLDASMERYVFGRTENGNHIIDLRKTIEKLQLAARVIVAMENTADVIAIALNSGPNSAPIAQRAVLKFSQYLQARHIAGRYTPGTLTNQKQKHFIEPRLLIIADPIKDYQPILEASYVNVPVIAMCNTDNSLRNIDIAIPCNTNSKFSVGLVWWMLAREVLRLRGSVSRSAEWEVMVDMFIYRDADDIKKDEQSKEESFQTYSQSLYEARAPEEAVDDYDPDDDFQATGTATFSWAGGDEQSGDDTIAGSNWS